MTCFRTRSGEDFSYRSAALPLQVTDTENRKEGTDMTDRIKVGIAGYGNLGRGVECALSRCPDMELTGVFTRRPPDTVPLLDKSKKAMPVAEAENMRGQIDVMILCGGSAVDLPEQGPYFASRFHTVDSFDTHAKIPEYFDSMNQAAGKAGHISILSVGWDPGLFSINRMMAEAILPEGRNFLGQGDQPGTF